MVILTENLRSVEGESIMPVRFLFFWTVFHQNGDSDTDSARIIIHAFDGAKTVVRTASERRKGSHSGRMHYVALLLQNAHSDGIMITFWGVRSDFLLSHAILISQTLEQL